MKHSKRAITAEGDLLRFTAPEIHALRPAFNTKAARAEANRDLSHFAREVA